MWVGCGVEYPGDVCGVVSEGGRMAHGAWRIVLRMGMGLGSHGAIDYIIYFKFDLKFQVYLVILHVPWREKKKRKTAFRAQRFGVN